MVDVAGGGLAPHLISARDPLAGRLDVSFPYEGRNLLGLRHSANSHFKIAATEMSNFSNIPAEIYFVQILDGIQNKTQRNTL